MALMKLYYIISNKACEKYVIQYIIFNTLIYLLKLKHNTYFFAARSEGREMNL